MGSSPAMRSIMKRKDTRYKQVGLRRVTTSMTSWLPEKFCIKDKVVKLKRGENEWEDGWVVQDNGGDTIRTAEEVNTASQLYKKTRKTSSDVYINIFMFKFDQTISKIILFLESPDSIYMPNGDELFWDEGDTITFGITYDDGVVYSQEKITHNELWLAALLQNIGELEFDDLIADWVDENEMISLYSESEVSVSYLYTLNDKNHVKFVNNPKVDHVGDREEFSIKGRIWKYDGGYVLSTWETFKKDDLYLIEKMLDQQGISPEQVLYQMGDNEEDPVEYQELLEYLDYSSNGSKTIKDLKAKAHLMGGYGKVIRNL